MSVRLKVEHGQDAGRVWRLKEAGVYVIGRDTTSAIRVLDMKVSKGHCELRIEESAEPKGQLRDLKSTHGTQLNGQPVSRQVPIKAGDEIRVGFTVLRVLSDGPADALVAPNGPLPPLEAPAARSPAAAPPGAGSGGSTGSDGAPPPAAAGAPAPAGAPGSAPSAEPSRALPPDALVGQTLGGYRVLQKIGQGGMGAVYLAEQVSLKREVALKVLSEKFVQDSAFVDQFLNEARAAGALNHPNVVQVYDVGQVDGRYFFSMEYVPGGAIEDRVKGKPASWEDALGWFLDAANALVFAQKRGILHRDVKPDNLMLAEDGSAKLCDLGLAKKSESSDLLAQGIIGTPHFISPEAIRRRADIDHRTDLYSLGCTFYRILSGENPYPAKTVKEILLGHLNRPVPRVTDRQPAVPKELSDVVFRLMQKEPAERFASADELYTALDRIRIQHGLAAHGIRPASRKPLVIAAVIGVLALGALAWVLTRPDKPREKSVEEIAAEQKAEQERQEAIQRAQAADREKFVTGARARLSQAEADVAKADVANTWNDARRWDEITQGLDTAAGELSGDAAFGSLPEVVAVVEDLGKLKAKVAEERRFHGDNAEKVKKAITDFRTLVETTCTGLKKRVQDELAPVEGQVSAWWKAAGAVTRDEVRKVVEKLREGSRTTVAGRDLRLMEPEDLDKRVKSFLPGEEWPGEHLYKQAFEAGKQAHAAELGRIEKALEAVPADDLEAAEDLFRAYLEALPEPAPEDRDPIAEQLRRQRGSVATRQRELLKERQEAVRRNVRADLADALRLVRRLREPGAGHLWTFTFPPADEETQRYALGMRDPRFKRFGRQLLADARAYGGLFDHLVASFKTWSDIELEGDDGKRQKVVEAAPDGLVCPAKVRLSWGELGHGRLLARVFFGKGDAPRFAFAPEDLRGLAVLAELAADGAAAQRLWTQYKATLGSADAEAAGWADERLSRLDLEMQAARLYQDLKEIERQVAAFQSAHGLPAEVVEGDPLRPRPKISPEQRDAVLRERAQLERYLLEAGMALRELAEREDVAGTLWGLSLRSELHPKAVLVRGQPSPDAPTAPPGPPAPPAPAPAPAPAPGPGVGPGGDAAPPR